MDGQYRFSGIFLYNPPFRTVIFRSWKSDLNAERVMSMKRLNFVSLGMICAGVGYAVVAVSDQSAIESTAAGKGSGEQVASAVSAVPAAVNPPAETNQFSDPLQEQSYAVGFDLGRTIKASDSVSDLDMFMKGIKDAVTGVKPTIDELRLRQSLMKFHQIRMEREQAKERAKGTANREQGKAFLLKNSKEPGVSTTATGLQYLVMKEGTGRKPKATDRVRVHYRGTLLDGTEFDSSYARGQPAEFPLSGVIPGWTEGLQLMTVGSKYKLFVPSELGYGPRGAGRTIGPDSTLVFEVELIDILQ